MRRKDREVTEPKTIDAVIENCKVLRLGLQDDEGVYIVPVCFAHKHENGKHTFFFHSAKEGRKVKILEENPVIGFEMDRGFNLKEAESACGYSAGYQSIIGKGIVTRIDIVENKRKALELIMGSYTEKNDWEFNEQALNAVYVFKIEVKDISCKENS